jgi:hypothetical protein
MTALRQYFILSLLLASSPAQEPPDQDPERLLQLRSIYEAGKQSIREDALVRHMVKLSGLQVALTKEGKLDAAASVREAVAFRKRELASLSGNTARTIVIKRQNARLKGGLKLTPNYIGNWKTNTGSATWTVPDIPPGKYDLHIDYIPVPGGGGTVEIRNREGSTVVRIGGATREKRAPRSTKVGTITLPRKKTVTFRVAPRSVSDRGLFLLTQMRLVATAK